MSAYVDFEPVGRRGDCPAGTSLLACARQLGVGLVGLCGGLGSCGRCVVQVLEGEVSPPTSTEERLLGRRLAQGYRLACCTVPLGHCKVRVPPESLSAPQRTQVEGEDVPLIPDPMVRSYRVTLSPPSLEGKDLLADADRLLLALTGEGLSVSQVDLALLQSLSPRLRAQGWEARACVRDHELIALLPADVTPLGLAVDLGTTKIAAYLVNLETGHTLSARGMMNPQIAYGEDVVTRMAYARQSLAQATRLQEVVVEALNQAIAGMAAEAGGKAEQVVEAVVVGNTAMHHLFLRLPVEQLAQAPYVPAISAALDVKAREIGLGIAPGAYIHLLPNIAGYVGADHVAMLLATGAAQTEGTVLALDIGTNTEICLNHRGKLTSVSCASGPAFEGAHIKHGMRAAEGAIERVRLTNHRVEYQTVGGVDPVGVCGSGILDSLAELYRAGIVDARGRMGEHPRVRNGTDGREFVLVSEEERGGRPAITITQKDIRELQLAKGAIRAGIEVLLEASGISAQELELVIIAGAFGTYINVESAVEIGMLPALPLERFRQVGNAAGTGARLALISRSKRSEAQAIARRVGYIELAAEPHFMLTFARAMALG
ncbi:MAG: ASKHA domain-containing protein [Anaerolineae bacterium]|nr:ASKHA domain-containing protein [Anaerolineae bacterium]